MALLQKSDLFVILKPNLVSVSERTRDEGNPNKLGVVPSYSARDGDECDVANSWWVVTNCVIDGGGQGHGPHDTYPDGWGVTAVEVKPDPDDCEPTGRRIFFRQSGCFSNELLPDDVRVIGQAILPKTNYIVALNEDY